MGTEGQFERINLPRHRARERRPIHVEFSPRSFPRQRFSIKMSWNSQLSRWNIEIEHTNINRSVATGVATPYRVYSYLPFCGFVFLDTSGKEERITPQNLQEEMHLYVVPGEAGRPSEDW